MDSILFAPLLPILALAVASAPLPELDSSLPSAIGAQGQMQAASSPSFEEQLEATYDGHFPTAGPMVGHVGPTRARIWAQGGEAGWFTVDYRPVGKSFWVRARGPHGFDQRVELAPERDFSGICELAELQPETRYEYRLVNADGQLLERSTQTFKTPPPEGQAEDFRVGFGSCAGHWGADPTQPIFEAIHGMHPEVFLWLGDNLYFKKQDREWADLDRMWGRWRLQRSVPKLQPLLAASANYAIWDDHDYGPDDSDKLYPLKDYSLGMFASYWANPEYAPGAEGGIWHRFTRGRVEFLMLDLRYARDPKWAVDRPEKSLLGELQWRWLEQALKSSAADFKVIVSSQQVLARYHRWESWHLYPGDRDRLIRLILDARVNGVVLLSGDRHQGEVLRWLAPEAPYPLYEFSVSPLAAGVVQPQPDDEVADRVPGTSVGAEHFGWLSFEKTGTPAAQVVFSVHDVKGRRLRKPLTIPASLLQLPMPPHVGGPGD